MRQTKLFVANIFKVFQKLLCVRMDREGEVVQTFSNKGGNFLQFCQKSFMDSPFQKY